MMQIKTNAIRLWYENHKAKLALLFSIIPFLVWICILFGIFRFELLEKYFLSKLSPKNYMFVAIITYAVLAAHLCGLVKKSVFLWVLSQVFPIIWTGFLAFSIWNYSIGDWRDGGYFFSFFVVYFSIQVIIWAITFREQIARFGGSKEDCKK